MARMGKFLFFALADFGVNAFILINMKYVVKLVDFVNTPLEKLPDPILFINIMNI